MLKLVAIASALLVFASPAGAGVAPGRVAFPVETGGVDVGGASAGVALPGGGAVLVAPELGRGFVAAQIGPQGLLDRSFGRRGVAHIAVPISFPSPSLPSETFVPLQLLRQADGRLLVVGSGQRRSLYELPQLMLVRLLPDGALDPTFGQAGIAVLGVQASCGECQPASLQPDGAIVVTGNTGSASPAIAQDPNAPVRFQWVIARLTATGGPDASFGQGGLVEVPAAVGRNGGGYATAVLGDGRIVALGRGPEAPLLTRLMPTGAPDPEFHRGVPASPPIPYGFEMLAHPDGTVDLLSDRLLVRYRSDGEPDPGFGDRGVLAMPAAGISVHMLPAGARGVLVYSGVGIDPRPARQGDLVFWRIAADGRFDRSIGGEAGLTVRLGFGGGSPAVFVRRMRRPAALLRQSGFVPGPVVLRPDGSLLVAGGVRVLRYTDEGADRSTGQFAAAALTPTFALDTSFGGPAKAPRLRIRMPTQAAPVRVRHKGLLLRITASTPGLVAIRARAARRVIAQGVEPIHAAGTSTVRLRLTTAGERLVRRRRGLSVTLRAWSRDLLAQETSTRARGNLRRRPRR